MFSNLQSLPYSMQYGKCHSEPVQASMNDPLPLNGHVRKRRLISIATSVGVRASKNYYEAKFSHQHLC